MDRLIHAAALAAALPLLAACGDTGRPTDPAVASAKITGANASGETRLVNAMDACDPTSFNAALGAGTCVGRNGGLAFEKFLAQIQAHGGVGAWHFAPPNLTAQEGERLVAVNRGGEVHTFTEVEEFGGGIVPLLNQLSGNTEVAPECLELEEDDFIAPGTVYPDEDLLEGGTVENYQCCIHPWMRTTVRVK